MSNKVQKKKRKQWDANQMVRAYDAIKKKEMGYLKASQVFNVPKSTLERFCKNETQSIAQLSSMKMGRKPTFTPAMEEDLVNYCLVMVSRFYGLRASDIRALAFQLAIKNRLPHQFNAERKIAGRKWMRKFLNRNPHLSFRTPQATSANRAKGFSKQKVEEFNDILEAELPKINYDPTKIFNVDETGVTIVQHKMEKVLCLKGQKQVGGLSSAERGALITLVTCMSASGFFVPPLFVFPRVNMKEELKDGAPPGSQFACHKSGWIQTHIFTQWIVHFINTVHPSKESPVILILDGHFSHTRNMDVIEKCRDSGVILICIPPHSSHRMQPLDVSFMSPFKTYYAKEIDTWLKNHRDRVVTAFQVAELVGRAYMRAATLEVAINGFRKSGIFPFNRNNFRDYDFATQDENDVEETDSAMFLTTTRAEPAHHPLPPVLTGTQTPPPLNFEVLPRPSGSAPLSLRSLVLKALQSLSQDSGSGAESTPLTVQSTKSVTPPLTTNKLVQVHITRKTNTKFSVKPADISPLPKMQSKAKISSQLTQLRGGKPLLVTSSPYKNELQEQLSKKQSIPETSKSNCKDKKKTKKKKKNTITIKKEKITT